MKKISVNILLLAAVLLCTFSCTKHKSNLATTLGNDCINRYYYVPFIVGSEMELAYAMYMPKGSGRIDSARVQCSVPGAAGTYFDNYAYSTDDYGQDLPHYMGEPYSNAGSGTYSVKFVTDTIAATLRFHYIIPEQARGRNVSFHFDVYAGGRHASYDTPDYYVRKMDMKLDIAMTKNRCFFNMETMQAYTAEEANAAGVPVDLVWAYSTAFTAKEDRSVFANPARLSAFSQFFTVTPPSTPLNNTEKLYRYTIIEPQLGRQEFDGFYVDDRDFERLELNCKSDGLIGINGRNGFWMETSDGRYKAYVYCNSTDAEGCKISVKRYLIGK